MADRFSRSKRSHIMSRITGDDLKPERLLRAALWNRTPGWCQSFNPKVYADGKLIGSPDVVLIEPMFGGCRVAVLVHGCFWHCCPKHFRMPKSGVDRWVAHFAKNVARDRRVRRRLRAHGYRTMVVWEHDLKTPAAAERAADRIVRRLKAISVDTGKR